MRNKIDYGIDLGTTNSAIARMENGVPVIKKSDTLRDTFPSCIHFNKRKDVIVGDAAYNAMRSDKARSLKTFGSSTSNTFSEFKRTMGTTQEYYSPHMDRSFSSEELSAEVIKTLKSVLDENISSIVITVPAKFLNTQNDATIKAAELLGFKQVQLLQEPVAAATAYGLGSDAKEGFWLVFDFGGGTFDAAILKSEEGIMTVKDTDGDNWLGGKNLDDAIVDQIIIPNLQSNYDIAHVIQDPIKREVLRTALKFYAEEAKIQSSFKDSVSIVSAMDDLPFEDANGEQPEIDVIITRSELERVIGPVFQKSVDITKNLLERNNLSGDDLGALILVGGPTYSPILRKMLKEQITEKINTSVDPMTVVAQGAALYASTISVSDAIKDENRDQSKIQLDLKYDASTVDSDAMINLKILPSKSSVKIDGKIYADIVRAEGSFSSGKTLISEKATLIELLLNDNRSNSFDINLYDDKGNRLKCEPSQFNILHGVGGLDRLQVLPYYVGIGRYDEVENKDLFEPVKGLEKNKQLPATGTINNLLTRREIKPGFKDDYISIPIYQGDYDAKGSNTLLNTLYTEIIISGESLPALLPEGSSVDLTIKIDSSNIMHFSAYFPVLEYTEELIIEPKAIVPPSENLLREHINNAKADAIQLQEDAIYNNLEELQNQLEIEQSSTDGKLKILDSLRKELLILDRSQKNALWPALEKALREAYFELDELIEKIKENGDGQDLNFSMLDRQLTEFKTKVEQIIQDKNQKEAKQLTSELGIYNFNLTNQVTGNAMDVQYLHFVDDNFTTFHWKDANKARTLTNQGLNQIANGSAANLRPILVQIIALMPEDEQLGHTLK